MACLYKSSVLPVVDCFHNICRFDYASFIVLKDRAYTGVASASIFDDMVHYV